jgi:hypothetical protein
VDQVAAVRSDLTPLVARLMGAYIARDQDCGREPRTVREFISEFRGLSGTAKQKAVLDGIGASRVTLPAFFGVSGYRRDRCFNSSAYC